MRAWSAQPCGKTECWYVARAVEGAQVGLGLRPGINREMFRMAIEANQAEHMLNWLDVRTGEMIYVDAGTVHAVGPNSILVETQQNCDITYRLYDYGRPRQLHLEHGMAAIREKTHAGRVEPQRRCDGHARCWSASPCFIVETLQDRSAGDARPPRRARARCRCWSAWMAAPWWSAPAAQPLPFMRGEAVVIPASLPAVTLRPQWQAEILRMRLPSQAVAEPLTTLHTGSTTIPMLDSRSDLGEDS